MEIYSEVSKELSSVNFDIDTTILMPITKGTKVQDYERNVNSLMQRVKILAAKKNKILDELDLLFAEDETKYDRALRLWLSAINTAFEKVCFNFQKGSLKPEIVNTDIKFWQSYMQVRMGVNKIRIQECGLFYAYTLYEIKNEIENRRTKLKNNDNIDPEKQIEPISVKLGQISLCIDFNELIDNLGNKNELLFEYKKGLEFAPDRKRYIEIRISSFEETLSRFLTTVEVRNVITKKPIPIQCGEYKRIGFAWVNSGFNATKEDFDLLIYRNSDLLVSPINDEDKCRVYLCKFQLLSEGGALAFHLAFLKNELNNCDLPKDQIVNLAKIFNDKNNSFEVCKCLLEELEITIGGTVTITPGKVGKLTGLITAIKNTPGMLKLDRPTDQLLLTFFNSYLNTTYKTFSKRNEAYAESIDASKRYIKQNFKK